MNTFDFISQELDLKLNSTKKKVVRLSLIRLLVFFLMGGSLVLGLAENPLWLIPALILAYFFIKSIKDFNFQKDQESIYLALKKIGSERESRSLRTLGALDSGTEFLDKKHPFANDLDLFGEHSLFQLVNHTFSDGGKAKLAAWMKSPFDATAILARKDAVEELAGKSLFLGAMEATGRAFSKNKPNLHLWNEWLSRIETIGLFHKFLAYLAPVVGLSILVAVSQDWLPTGILAVWVLIGMGALASIFNSLKQAAEAIPLSQALKSFHVRAGLIEEEDFQSDLLKREKDRLSTEIGSVSKLLEELDSLGLWVQNRINLLYLPVNLFFWSDFLLYIRLVAWRNKVGDALSHLSEHLENWEKWVSLGAAESELQGGGKVQVIHGASLAAEELNHPLILPNKSVANSLSFGSDQRIVLLTGANMSGKTTFMRTLGINCVLANIGLSPFGKSIHMGEFQLFTSMRNSDNLGESVSSFYAELSRIKSLILRMEAGEAIFFLLDEILKGTNTEDRISGSRALIHQILKTQGFGIISTHDIELSEMGNSVENLHNYSFHSEIQEQTILFDYLLKKGPCTSFNAHKLMELMGIRFAEN